jgi:hypothetical protein
MRFFKKKEKIVDSKPLKAQNRKLLYVKIIIGATILAWITFSTMYFINTHDFVSPIIFQNPMPEKQIKIISPIGTPSAQLIEKPDVHKVARKIYGLESSFGKNDSCRQQGQYNGYGYGQNTSTWNCFESFEIVTSKVENWIQDKLSKGDTLAEAICLYNTGIKQDSCDYYQNFLSL